MNQHTAQVTIHRKDTEPLDGGHVTFHGEDYDTFTEAQALAALMPNGTHDERLSIDDNLLMWRGIMMPVSEFQHLEVSIVAKSKPE